MSMPAARVGDMTVHPGGTIIPPGAAPNRVLIENMPAARIGDMHTCPVVTPGTPPVPHVGGAITMGSPTVLIGNMPAARVTSVCTCTGPPDTIRPPGGVKTLIGLGSAGGPVVASVSGDSTTMYSQFPGQQQGGSTAALQSANQVSQRGGGRAQSEAQMQATAVEHGYVPGAGTPVSAQPAIVAAVSGGKVTARVVPTANAGADAAAALDAKKGVIANGDAARLWNDPAFAGAGHSVVVTGAVKGPDGAVMGLIINDTATGYAGQCVGAAQFTAAMSSLTITDQPILARPPA